jgi:uncharacterized protein DUF4230
MLTTLFRPRVLLATAAGLLLVALGGRWLVARAVAGLGGPGRTTITQGVVIERLKSVAKLVTTEVGLRDVVTYQNTRLGSTKRALVVVTGTALVGLDLADKARVTIDQGAHRIRVVAPRASLIAVDITDLRTYDEQRGLWNPFHPADRDTIFLLARAQLMHAANDLSVLEHAERSARQAIIALLGADGYTVEVEFQPFLREAPPAELPAR